MVGYEADVGAARSDRMLVRATYVKTVWSPASRTRTSNWRMPSAIAELSVAQEGVGTLDERFSLTEFREDPVCRAV
jgi:hypothetical protein